jgi:hypothetical protein
MVVLLILDMVVLLILDWINFRFRFQFIAAGGLGELPKDNGPVINMRQGGPIARSDPPFPMDEVCYLGPLLLLTGRLS